MTGFGSFRRWTCATFAIVLLAGGCAAGRPSPAVANVGIEDRMPERWTDGSGGDAAPLTTHFLNLIDDGRLRALLREALAANHDLLALARRLDAATWQLTETEAPRWPVLTADLRRTRTNLTIDEQAVTEQRLVLAGSWELDLWGRLAKLNDENAAHVASLAADFALARDALGARVIQGWVAGVSIRRAMETEEERVAVLEQLQETIRRRYLTGIGSLDDLAAARAATELARANVVALEAELGEAHRTLELFLGRPPRAALDTPSEWPVITPVDAGYPLATVFARNDVVAAMSRLEAADAAAAAAVRARLPSVRISGEGGPGGGAKLGDVLTGKFAWSLVTSLTQPIFQRGLLRARSEARRLEFEAAWEEYMGVVWRAVAEIDDAIAREEAMLRQRDLLSSAAVESARNTGIQEDRYRLGLVSVIELLSVRNQELDIRRQVIALNGEVLGNRVALALAVGASFGEVTP